MHHTEEGHTPIKKNYSYQDLIKFQDPNMYSSLGKMKLANMLSSPSMTFGTATRDKQQKVFQSKELCKSQFIGKTSPGPSYEVRHTDKYYYKNDPTFSFGTAARNTLNTGSKYAHYHREDIDFDPNTADLKRRMGIGSVKIGLANRFESDVKKGHSTPGPEYSPGPRPEYKNLPTYSFGQRRPLPGHDPLAPIGSTSKLVGPGAYLKLDEKPITTLESPKFSFGKEKKFRDRSNDLQKHITYDVRSSIGQQPISTNKTLPSVGFTKARKDFQTGIFKDHMTKQPARVSIKMPNF